MVKAFILLVSLASVTPVDLLKDVLNGCTFTMLFFFVYIELYAPFCTVVLVRTTLSGVPLLMKLCNLLIRAGVLGVALIGDSH